MSIPKNYRLVPVALSPAIKDAITECGHFYPETLWQNIIAKIDLVSGHTPADPAGQQAPVQSAESKPVQFATTKNVSFDLAASDAWQVTAQAGIIFNITDDHLQVSIDPNYADTAVRDAAECHIDSLDAYGEDLVPINRTRGTAYQLRMALSRPPAFKASPANALTDAGWQPIGTAPKDGFARLYLVAGYCLQGFVDAAGELMVQSEVSPHWRKMRSKPTHWQPLPAAPAHLARNG